MFPRMIKSVLYRSHTNTRIHSGLGYEKVKRTYFVPAQYNGERKTFRVIYIYISMLKMVFTSSD